MLKKIYISDVLILLIPILLVLSMFGNIPYSSNFDEVAALLGLIYLIAGLRKKHIRALVRKDYLSIFSIIIIGLLGNIFIGLVRNPSYIINDMFSFSRIFLVYLGSVAFLEDRHSCVRRVSKILGKFSEFFIYIAFVCGVLNIVGIVDMSTSVRFGIRSFNFIFSNASQFGIFVGAALALCIISGCSNKITELMGVLVLIMTAKGTSLIIVSVYLLLRLFLRRSIKWWHVLLIIIGLAAVLRFQIQEYILNDAAPRALLLYYGIITATRFFPLGAGFATYGSNMAAVHYSPLYYEYGFHLRKALAVYNLQTGEGTYLNDTYLGMVLGEFGFIGTLIFVIFFYRIWKKINRSSSIEQKSKQIIIAIFVCLCGSFVMLGSIKNAPGQILMFTIALFIALEKQKQAQLLGKV